MESAAEPLAIEPVQKSQETIDTLDQEAAREQQDLNLTKSRPVSLTDTGLQIRGYNNESKQR